MDAHISALVRGCFYQLRQLKTIIGSLIKSAAGTLVHAFIHSRLDYCNDLLFGISDVQIRRQQPVQNASARLVTGRHCWEHVTPSLLSLHWLPVRQRVQYKIAMTVFRCLSKTAPLYLCDLCRPLNTLSRTSSLRSHSLSCLHVPRTNTKYGKRAFSVAGPAVWNSLRNPDVNELTFAKIAFGAFVIVE